MSTYLNIPHRTEAQATADRIRRRMQDHIAALVHHGALDREIARELQTKLDSECAIARPKLSVVP